MLPDIYPVNFSRKEPFVMRPIVVIESPYKASKERSTEFNEAFARRICAFAVRLGYAPFAAHLFYTQFLDDNNPDERRLGIHCNLSYLRRAAEVWFCHLPGGDLTDGMAQAFEFLKSSEFLNRRPPVRKRMVFDELGNFLHATLL